MTSAADVIKTIKDKDIRFVDLRFTDPRGKMQHVTMEAALMDEGAFADALEAYARDPELRRRHGEAGLAYAQTMDWDRINSAVVRVYLRVIEKRARLARMTGR